MGKKGKTKKIFVGVNGSKNRKIKTKTIESGLHLSWSWLLYFYYVLLVKVRIILMTILTANSSASHKWCTSKTSMPISLTHQIGQTSKTAFRACRGTAKNFRASLIREAARRLQNATSGGAETRQCQAKAQAPQFQSTSPQM